MNYIMVIKALRSLEWSQVVGNYFEENKNSDLIMLHIYHVFCWDKWLYFLCNALSHTFSTSLNFVVNLFSVWQSLNKSVNGWHLPESRVPGLHTIDVPRLIPRPHFPHQEVKVVNFSGDVNLLDHHIARLSKVWIKSVFHSKPFSNLWICWKKPFWLVLLW